MELHSPEMKMIHSAGWFFIKINRILMIMRRIDLTIHFLLVEIVFFKGIFAFSPNLHC